MVTKIIHRTTQIFILILLFFIEIPLCLVQAGTQVVSNHMGTAVKSSIDYLIRLRTKKNSRLITEAIKRESQKFNFDPLILVSIIEVESGFKVNRRGRHGEIGLMQIKPSTARWVAKKFGLPWNGPKTLERPHLNIQIGTAYLSYLRKEFSTHQHLYLSAYNMGSGKLRKSMKSQVIPVEYASRVSRQYQKYYSQMFYTHKQVNI